jgi:hypothetical protein
MHRSNQHLYPITRQRGRVIFHLDLPSVGSTVEPSLLAV